MKLSETACKKAKPTDKAQRLADGNGLYLEVSPTGGKYWRMKYRFNGKEKRLAIGVYPDVTLHEAREKRRLAKKELDAGRDPSEVKKLARLEIQNEYENSFENVAREWHSQRKHTWKEKHAENILKRMEADLFPHIGKRPIKAIAPYEILAAVKKVEERGSRDLAHRMMQMCGQVFRYGVASGVAVRDVTADLKGALQPVKSIGYKHLKESELPAFLRKLENYERDYGGRVLTKLAFKLLVLTFVRSGEIRGALWSEFDFDKAQWKIPASRMKMKEEHIVPLSTQSIKVLRELHTITGHSKNVFPSQHNPRGIMSENTFLRVLDVLGYKSKATGHGFRSTASTILNEHGFRADVIERQLAHAERNQIRAAYNHAEYLPERITMMQWWGDYVEQRSK
jgi:integrase